MNNQANAKVFSVQRVPVIYKALFDEDLDFWKFIELCPDIARRVGANPSDPFLFCGTVKNFKLELPCNVETIEYVASSRPVSYWAQFGVPHECALVNYRVDQSRNEGEFNPNATNIDNIGESTCGYALYSVDRSILDAPRGALVNFQNDNNCCLKFNFEHGQVDVVFQGKILDEEQFPMYREVVLFAMAYFMKYGKVKKDLYKQIANPAQLGFAKDDWERAAAQARSPDSISTNAMDQILNAVFSNDRKYHNVQKKRYF